MYSYEDRMKAVKLYIQYDHSLAAVIRELGYPSQQMLLRWYQEYAKLGDLHKTYEDPVSFTEEQKRRAIKYYLEHGKNAARTVRVLGYPCRQTFSTWLDEAYPNRKKRCITGRAMVKYSQEKKEQAVVDLCARKCSAEEIAISHGVSRFSLYKWEKQLLSKEQRAAMPKKSAAISQINAEEESHTIHELLTEKAALEQQLASLKEDVYRLQLERDVLETAAKVLKKDKGINLQTIRNYEKAEVIDALRKKYRLKELLHTLGISKSSYYYQEKCLHGPDKYAQLRADIYALFHIVDGRYGYRRISASLKTGGKTVSEKVVRRLMKESELRVRCVKRKKYSSYAGEISPEVPNAVNRDFHADTPNAKWLTDITEFGIPAGKVYLSPIIDCFDGLVVAWSIGTSPSADLANAMLDKAVALLKEDERPIIHSDRGGHYRWPGWIERMETAGLTRSMSKKGCSPDNSACEGFFGRLKNEMFYGRPWKGVSLEAFIATVNRYIRWYNEERIKESLGWMSPIEYRHSLGLAA